MSPWVPVLKPERIGKGKETVRETGSGSVSGSALEGKEYEEEYKKNRRRCVLRVGGRRVR